MSGEGEGKRRSIAVLDLGGQYAHLIVNRVRRLGAHAELVPLRPSSLPSSSSQPNSFLSSPEELAGIIFSGGGGSVVRAADSASSSFASFLDLVDMDHILSLRIPVLGLCLGHQYVAAALGGQVVSDPEMSEYGPIELAIQDVPADVNQSDWILHKTGRDGGDRAVVWMSHGDSVVKLPSKLPFHVMASTLRCPIAAYACPERKIYGFQFHPEVTHSENGMAMLRAFLSQCRTSPWDMTHFLPSISEAIRTQVKDNKVFILVSGGVDSSVAFALLAKALGKERCYGLLVDHGLLRHKEAEEVTAAMRAIGFDNLHLESASDLFLSRLEGVFDPEEKRKIIGQTFLDVKVSVAQRFKLSDDEWLLGQGTIYPDTIETGGTAHSSKIKTHHNRIDAFDEMIKSGRLVEPLRDLYKDEVRDLGRLLGLPPHLVDRHPFPGPGLGVRILCAQEPYAPPSLSQSQQQIQFILNSLSLHKFGVTILPIRSVGVQGDNRSYKSSACLFAPGSISDITEEEWNDIWRVSQLVPNQVLDVNRVVLCLSHSKVEIQRSDADTDLPPFVVTPGYVTSKRADKLRLADHHVAQLVQEMNLYSQIWQFPVVLLPIGLLKGHESVVLRPVDSTEAMTAMSFHLPIDFLLQAKERLSAIDGIDGIFYDLTSKPPGTIEWE